MRQKNQFDEKELKSVTNQIVEGYDPDKIILFGSFAKGESTPESDYDLFIIKKTREKFHDRMTNARRAIHRYPSRGIDMLVYTPEELKRAKSYFIDLVLSEGKVLYEKSPLQR